jgi:hypothetical protein
MGAYHAVCKYVPVARDNPVVRVIVVGDGTTPRTGALFAFRSNWQCYSVDPKMNHKWVSDHKDGYDQNEGNIRRLHVIPYTIEEYGRWFTKYRSLQHPLIVVAVHAHVAAQTIVESLPCADYLVCIPCCVPQHLGDKPCISYQDINIWSPLHEVKIWDLTETK